MSKFVDKFLKKLRISPKIVEFLLRTLYYVCLEWSLLNDLKFFCAKNPRNNNFFFKVNRITVCHTFHGKPFTVTSIYFISSFYFRVHRKRMFIWSGIRFGLLTKRFVGKKTESNSSKSCF